ncbi:MAG: 3-deoxy-7-phosphoheptulonate synthase [Treponema sp.]|nr:3-deoxy-7-phosphoheptulonate synthase [Treponema sp.]MCL2181546.1 3-deoxy-7-phosphoheptulonate synthase [Treponema sp.]
MIIALKPGVSREDIIKLTSDLENLGVKVDSSQGASQIVLGLVGDTTVINDEALRANHLVERVIRVQEPYKRANRAFHPMDTVLEFKSGDKTAKVGGGSFAVIAGPCSVESREQLVSVAEAVKKSGAAFLRGGAFKPRTSPYSFQGMGCEGIDLLVEAKKATGLPIVTELMEISQLELFEDVDMIQVGARNMQNFNLLKELGRSKKPILLKRGMASTMTELLMAAEYVMAGGNSRIVLCERGIRGFDNFTRNILDLAIVPALKKKTHLPVIVDPSHATGLSWMVPAMSKAAIASGADGIIVEVHNDPEHALCDGEQSLTPEKFENLMGVLRKYAEIEGKTI